jgi:hemerythrin
MVNRLHRACRAGAGREEMLKMLHFLGGYAQDHFRHEEAVMEENHCPAGDTNKSAHRQFLQDYGKLVEIVKRDGATTSVLLQVKTMVSDWLRNHICSVDTRLRDCVSFSEPGEQATASEACPT